MNTGTPKTQCKPIDPDLFADQLTELTDAALSRFIRKFATRTESMLLIALCIDEIQRRLLSGRP